MTHTTDDVRTDERRIDYEYRAEVPAVPEVGTTDPDPDAFRITGAPELAETPEPVELMAGQARADGRQEGDR